MAHPGVGHCITAVRKFSKRSRGDGKYPKLEQSIQQI
jgi:hypothetical protein